MGRSLPRAGRKAVLLCSESDQPRGHCGLDSVDTGSIQAQGVLAGERNVMQSVFWTDRKHLTLRQG